MAQPKTADQPETLAPALASMTVLVAAVIVHDQATNRIVLLQRGRDAKFAPGMWDLPGGKSEPGEPITETAVRELHEEAGLTVRPESLAVAHIVHGAWGAAAPNGYLTVVFTTTEWSGELRNREPHKHAEVLWAGTDELPDDFVPTTASALDRHLNQGPDITLRGWR